MDDYMRDWLARIEGKLDKQDGRLDEMSQRMTRLEEGRVYGERDFERAELRVGKLEVRMDDIETGVLKLSMRQKIIIAAIGLGGGALGGVGSGLITKLLGAG